MTQEASLDAYLGDAWACARPDLAVLRFSGRDVLSFLQSKLAANTSVWRRDGGSYAVATDINGKVLFDGDFALHGNDVIAVIPASRVDAARAHLDGYIIMEDVEITADPVSVTSVSLSASAALGVNLDLFEAAEAVGDGLVMRAYGAVPAAEHLFVLQDAPADIGDNIVALPSYMEATIAAGIPVLGRDFEAEKTIAIVAGLWRGLSLSKGCYLGQEVLERLFSRGSAARRLVRWHSDDATVSGTLHWEGSAVGEVTSAVVTADGSAGIAELRRKAFDVEGPLMTEAGAAVHVVGYVGGPTPENP